MPSVFIKTYGCQMNERDSEAVAAQLVAKGYTLARSEGAADVVLLNTCSVRDFAEQKAINKMRNVAGTARSEKRTQILGFMGCMAQSRGKELIDRLPDVDLVLGTQKFHRAAEYLDELLAGKRDKIVDVEAEAKSEAAIREHLVNGSSKTATSAFVSIMQGCNQHCTFCIVPATRGEERSRTIPDIVAECRELVGRGVKEITLLGQIVTSYAKRDLPILDGKSPFVQLLDAVHEIEGLERIRFTSPHPKGYGDDLAEAYARLPKLCESAHIPLQSGSDRILKLMHRGYTRERFLAIIQKLRQAKPGIGITTDIIVGFPGETDEDFEQTRRLCVEVDYDMAYVFKYSVRTGTPAATMGAQVPEEVREERNQILLEVLKAGSLRRSQALVGTVQEVLVEGRDKTGTHFAGRTPGNRAVVFDAAERLVGSLVPVEITRASVSTLYGNLVVQGAGLQTEPSPASL